VSWKSSGREDVGKSWSSLIVFLVDRLGRLFPCLVSAGRTLLMGM
jgi:hypothetical protein